MKEITYKIPDESASLVTELVEKLGGSMQQENINAVIKKNKAKKAPVPPTFLFGKWKNLNIDAKKLREQAWDRSQKF